MQADRDRANAITSGHRACQGCGEALGARFVLDAAMRATGGKTVIANATGCLEVFSTPYPESSWQLAWVHSLFGNAAAVASGIAAALQAQAVAAYRSDLREAAWGFVSASVICWVIWGVTSGGGGFPWPVFVMLGTGLHVLRLLVMRGAEVDERRRRLERKARKALNSEHGRDREPGGDDES